MGQRRKHVLQSAFAQDVQPPTEHQHIVRALGSRGGNIVEVQYPSGATTLCMMPARFNRKLWVRRGGFLIVESSPEAEQDAASRVTGTICAVLYEEHIKQLKKQPGVWPEEFAAGAQWEGGGAGQEGEEGAEEEMDMPEADSSSDSGSSGDDCSGGPAGSGGNSGAGAGPGSRRQAAAAAAGGQEPGATGPGPGTGAAAGAAAGDEGEGDADSDSDSGLPPLQQINNRRVVQHYASDSDSEDGQG